MATTFRFDKDFDFDIRSPQGALQGMKAYKAGTIDTIPEAHAEAAEKAGAGQRTTAREAKKSAERA